MPSLEKSAFPSTLPSPTREEGIKKLKSLFIFPGLLLVLSLSGLFGCQSPEPNKETHSQKITLEFWTLQLDTFESVLKPMFADYEKLHPNIKIHWVDIPFSEGPKRTLTAMMSEQTPDVVNLNPDFSAILANRKALIDMNQAVSSNVRDAYLPTAWQAASLALPKQQPLAFGLPWYLTSAVTLYNKSILKQAGYQTPPKTWDEVASFARNLHQHSRAYGMMPTMSENGHFLKELQSLGIQTFDSSGKAVFSKQKAAVDHLQDCVTLYRNGAFPAEMLTESHQSAVARYQAGTLAMINIGSNFLKILKENSPAAYAETGVASQFPDNTSSPDFSLMLLTVPIKSAHPKEAVEFASYLTNDANQLKFAQVAPVLPSTKEALKAIQIVSEESKDLMAQGRALSAAQVLHANASYALLPDQNTINQSIDYYVQMALMGKQSPQSALAHAEQDINAILQQP